MEEGKRKRRFDTTLLLRMPKEMRERLKEFAHRRGLTVASAIRFLIAEALMEEEWLAERAAPTPAKRPAPRKSSNRLPS
jgi:predicted DNA-binding protein